jgi:hypothetical protein
MLSARSANVPFSTLEMFEHNIEAGSAPIICRS